MKIISNETFQAQNFDENLFNISHIRRQLQLSLVTRSSDFHDAFFSDDALLLMEMTVVEQISVNVLLLGSFPASEISRQPFFAELSWKIGRWLDTRRTNVSKHLDFHIII